MAYLVFTDGFGAATLRNNRAAPADRFSAWTPDPTPSGDAARRQSDSALFMYRLRDDYKASFELRGIRAQVYDGVSMLDVAARLCYHLRNGGTCEVHTEDDVGASYLTCGLADGADPRLTLANRSLLEYTLALVLVNLAASPVPLTCHYGGIGGSW